MTKDEKELVFRIGQACWWLLMPEKSAAVIDPDRKVREFIRSRLAYVITGIRLEEGYESFGAPEAGAKK